MGGVARFTQAPWRNTVPESLTFVVSLLTALGIGGIGGSVVQYLAEKRKQVQSHHFEVKQRRYAAIIIMMIARIGPIDDLSKVTKVRPDLQSLDDLIRELDVELLNAFLYASDPVIERFAEFIRVPSRRSLIPVADAMRSDLYGRANRLELGTIENICGLGLIGQESLHPETGMSEKRIA
jgi:hypothetical protein